MHICGQIGAYHHKDVHTDINNIEFNSLELSVFVECDAGYFGTWRNCTLCPGNTIKPSRGDAESCPVWCNGNTSVPNYSHTQCGTWVSH